MEYGLQDHNDAARACRHNGSMKQRKRVEVDRDSKFDTTSLEMGGFGAGP